MTATTPELRHVNEEVAAKVLGVSKKTLQDWRFHGVGPAYAKFSNGGGRGAVRYSLAELERYAKQCAVQPRNP
jgi:hypothetical protein